MTGPAMLKVQKGLLTRYSNQLARLLEWHKEHPTPPDARAAALALKAKTTLVSDALQNFAKGVDEITEEITEDQNKAVDQLIESTEILIADAQALAIQLEIQEQSSRGEKATVTPVALPAIPIPTFTGNLLDFKNFWTLFQTNVHSQPLTKLQKFNYLISSLRGDARELIRRYPVTEDNYDHAIALLKAKYADESKIIAQLHSQLEKSKAENRSTLAQRRLLETLIPIVIQLHDLKISLDGSYFAHKILAKFTPALQRKVLEQRLPLCKQDSDWKMEDILSALDCLLTTDEQINEMVEERNYQDPKEDTRKPTTKNKPFSQSPSACIFCNSTQHRGAACFKYPRIQERRTFLQQHNRCLNCAREGHFATQCPANGCQLCPGKRHHHTICPQRVTTASTPTSSEAPPVNERQKALAQTTAPKKTPSTPIRKAVKQPRVPQIASAHPVQTRTETAQEAKQGKRQDTTVLHSSDGNTAEDDVVLLTGIARVRDDLQDTWTEVEILFDTGADQSFICQSLANELGLTCSSEHNFLMYTFGSDEPKPTQCGLLQLDLWDHQGQRYPVHLCTTAVLIGQEQTVRLSEDDRVFVAQHNLRLSKPTNSHASKPQILLGCDQMWDLLDVALPRYTLPSGLQLIPSKLGYLLTGKQNKPTRGESRRDVHTNVVMMMNAATDEEDEVTRWDKYWTMDSAGICEFTGTKQEEKAAVNEQVTKFFNDTIQRRNDGYYVRLPYKDNHPPLPDNKSIALKRLQSVLEKLKTDPNLLEDYRKTFQTQLENGIIEEIPNDQPRQGAILHYIPHQPVVTPHKETTKLRIVFDASSHYKECPSLNDILHQGPLVLPDLYAMLIRFRMFPFVAIADVEKAFLQVRLHELDRDATRFLWVRDTNSPIIENNLVTYRFTRVTFGLNVSPFLLAGTILHHLRHAVDDDVLAREIQENLYVDNLFISADTPEDLKAKVITARQIFADMEMNLREFLSNHTPLGDSIPAEACAKSTMQKVLGINWDAKQDCLSISCSVPPTPLVTKRTVARQIASIYDPLGWLVPLLTRAKHFQQFLWKEKLTWDEVLPTHLEQQWHTILQDITGFQRTFPRNFYPHSKESNLAVFADASEIAMSTCAYLYNTNNSTLVMAKCKLPSIKCRMTMPKMEMNALTMAVRLTWSLYQAMKDPLSRLQQPLSSVTIFSDSQIALSWLASAPSSTSPGVLICNRLKEIRKIIDALAREGVTICFGYVNTKDNPADAGTRGLTQKTLQHHFWWTGPEFLHTPSDHWPVTFYPYVTEEDPKEGSLCAPGESVAQENKEVHVFTTQTRDTATDLLDWKRHNQWILSQKVVAYVLRFIARLVARTNPQLRQRVELTIPELRSTEALPYITATEMETALRVLIRNHQQVYLPPSQQKVLKQLKLEKDEHGILRCRGRMGNSSLPVNARYPCLIATKTKLAQLIVEDAHSPLHCGIAHTMANVRKQFWIPKLRQMARKVVGRCVPCQKLNNLPYRYPDMDDLPERRVQRTRPFEHIGIDYFGPLSAKRDDETVKVYGIILTCATTRMIHLELVPDMSTNHLLLALRRFFARRGVPASITSDNGPNFLLGEQVLRDTVLPVLNDVSFAQSMANKGIVWKTITPYAPWQGALYERLIKSVKHSLYKVLQRTVPTQEVLETLLTEIEGCLNTRPLTYQEEKWEDTPILRPIDFIQRDIIISYPFESIQCGEEDANYHPSGEAILLRNRQQAEEALKTSHQLTERFWSLWSQQYLTSLRESHKLQINSKRSTPRLPTKGTVVLISDPVIPRNAWKLGKITDLKPSATGMIREAELQMPNGRKIRRPINLLIPLELSNTEDTCDHEQHDNSGAEEEISGLVQEPVQHRYDLRPNRRLNYREMETGLSRVNSTTKSLSRSLVALALCTLLVPATATTSTITQTPIQGFMQCVQEGIRLTSSTMKRFELCAADYCVINKSPAIEETIQLPPEITLHEYAVQWKIFDGDHVTLMETTCPPVPFCENVRCWFCTANIFNPECSPVAAIVTIAVILYVAIALLYAVCYIPLTLGKPFRLMLQGMGLCLTTMFALGIKLWMWRRNRTQRGNRRTRIELLLSIVTLLATVAFTQSCQDVDIFQLQTTVCRRSPSKNETCKVDTTQILKMNTFHREACFRITKQGLVIKEIHLEWKRLQLVCDKQTVMFTRHTVQRVIDAKRCPRSGSCTENKCENVNTTTLISELSEGNEFPGLTYCVESCGGPGCGCFYLSSGCLFYRIYATPVNDDIYEIFRCPRWREQVMLQRTVTHLDNSVDESTVVLQPTVPQEIGTMKITLSSITIHPTPALQTSFITDGNDTAIWTDRELPTLQCDSMEAAENLECQMQTNCKCQPAENRVNCACVDKDITKDFHAELQNRLPLRRPWIEFEQHDSVKGAGTVIAVIRTLSTAELIVTINEEFDDTAKEVTESICSVEDTTITGCYHCPQGAVAKIVCVSQEYNTMAAIQCNDTAFTVPCSPRGSPSSLRFSLSKAQVQLQCTSSCGTVKKTFEVTGVLFWTKTILTTAEKIIAGESKLYDEWALPDMPDIGHIVDVITSWYKVTIITIIVLLVAIITGYLFFWSHGIRIFLFCSSAMWHCVRRILQFGMRMVVTCIRCAWNRRNRCNRSHTKEL